MFGLAKTLLLLSLGAAVTAEVNIYTYSGNDCTGNKIGDRVHNAG